MRRSLLRHLVSKAWMLFFFSVSKHGPYFTVIEEDAVDKRRVHPELACEADGVALAIAVITVIAEAIPMRISAEQVPSSKGCSKVL